jgi:hypothetical protein
MTIPNRGPRTERWPGRLVVDRWGHHFGHLLEIAIPAAIANRGADFHVGIHI